MPVNPSLRLCSTVCPPLGPPQEKRHHVKPERSAAIDKQMNQVPTAKSDTHWLSLCVTPITDVMLVCSKEQTHQKLPPKQLLLRDGNKPTIHPSTISSPGGLPRHSHPFSSAETPLLSVPPPALPKALRNTNDHILLKLLVCMLLENRNSGSSTLRLKHLTWMLFR